MLPFRVHILDLYQLTTDKHKLLICLYGVASDSLLHIDIVSPEIRRDIISGKDINLAAPLIPGNKGELENNRHLVQCRDRDLVKCWNVKWIV